MFASTNSLAVLIESVLEESLIGWNRDASLAEAGWIHRHSGNAVNIATSLVVETLACIHVPVAAWGASVRSTTVTAISAGADSDVVIDVDIDVDSDSSA